MINRRRAEGEQRMRPKIIRQRTFAEIERDLAEMTRLVNQYPGRRQTAAARLSAAEVYAARAVRAALPRGRDPICEQTCHERADGREACDELYCKATVKMRPRPRSIQDVIRERRPR
jgi:hypothetical protein